jgi:anti-anti-sigma regulatory factor
MSTELVFQEKGNHLTLSGLLTIEHAQQLQDLFSRIIAYGDHVFVSLARVEDVDAAGLQVLYAARTEVLRDNRQFIWTEISAACSENAALAGMSRFLGFQEATGFSLPE